MIYVCEQYCSLQQQQQQQQQESIKETEQNTSRNVDRKHVVDSVTVSMFGVFLC